MSIMFETLDEFLLDGDSSRGLETIALTVNVDEEDMKISFPRAGLLSKQFVQIKIASPFFISSFISLDVPAQWKCS